MGGAPCHLYVLMWKKWIYYKRHKCELVWTFVKPILCFAVLTFVITLQRKAGAAVALYRPCTSAGESLATDGPVPAVLSTLLQSNMTGGCDSGGVPGMGSGTCKDDGTQKQSCLVDEMIPDADKRILDNAEKSPVWMDKLKAFDPKGLDCVPTEDPSKKKDKFYVPPSPREEQHMNLICTLLEKKILYYPKTAIVNKIMTKVKDVILQFERLLNDTQGSSGPNATTTNSTTNSSSHCSELKNGVRFWYGDILKQYVQLINGADDRVIGFDSLEDLQKYTFPLSKFIGIKNGTGDKMGTKFPGIWSILSFKDMSPDAAVSQFSFLYDNKMTSLEYILNTNDEIFWLQDLVEQAIIEVVSNKTVQIGTVLKQNPTKCWHKPTTRAYSTFAMFFTFLTILAFLSQPATFLYQILEEKELKLREYLYIMGVSSMMLKLSWILFYTIMLLPLAIIWCTLVVIVYAQYLNLSNVFFFYVLLMGYNVSMLCFCYMLSNLFQTPKGSTAFIYFIHMFVTGIAIFNFGHSMSPGTTYLARLLSLHPVVPFIIGVSFMLAWEDVWVGSTTSTMWMSPIASDIYNGLGEAFVWMVLYILVYVFLAWYLEMLFPGEFGQAHPFYFLFTPTYWMPPYSTMPEEIEEPKADVEPVHDKEAGIVIDKLSKVYSKGKIAVNQLSLIFYKNDITAFLGHNGAGKSTTMNCLVGMINVSGGTATVAGYDIRKSIESVRQSVGFVPQYDILYPEFTVRDHCKFYGWLKNLSTEEIAQMTEVMLAKMGLSKMMNQKTIVLSGGQKRKLSVITAYFGAPSVVIFDEPTSGVDPFSRRAIWEVILAHKSSTTTVLSTHFMDEADILGNRVAVINEGELKCAGSPMYLKSKYGKGYRLTIARRPEAKQAVTAFITKLLPESQMVEELGNDMDFQLSKETAHSDKMIEILRNVEDNMDSVGIQSYALNEPNMNEVFFTCTAAENVHRGEDLGAETVGETSDQLQYEKRDNLGQQAVALFVKKFWSTIYSASLILLQTVVPLVFVIMTFLGSSSSDGALKRLIKIPESAGQNMFFMQNYPGNNAAETYLHSSFKYGYPPVCPGDSCNKESQSIQAKSGERFEKTCEKCDTFCERNESANEEAHGDLPNGAKMFALGTTANASSWILLVNQTLENLIAGFQFHARDGTCAKHNGTSDQYVTVFYQEKLKHAVLNLWHTLLLRNMTKNGAKQIQVYIESETLGDPMLGSGREFDNQMFEMFKGMFIVLAFIFGSFGVIIALYSETSTGLKRLQLIYGANPYLYWVANLGFDMLVHLCTLLIIVIPLAIFENSYNDFAGAVFVTGFLYGYHAITYFYLMSFICTKSSTAIGVTIFLGIFLALLSAFAGLFIIFAELMTESKKCNPDAGPAKAGPLAGVLQVLVPVFHILTFQPSFLIGDAIISIGFYGSIMAPRQDMFDKQCKMQQCMCGYGSVFAVLGQKLLKFFMFGTINLIIVLVLEAIDCKCSCLGGDKAKGMVWSGQSQEPDVAAEQARVEAGSADNDSLMVKHLCKSFGGMPYPAVNNISFGVPKAETFGLLGLNGAGKTTTFSMLTGFVTPTSGSASILGINLFGKSWSRFNNSSYCPQENKLFKQLTIEQHIKLFAALRGIPNSVIDELMKRLIVEVGLEPHKGKRAGALSGGNQRKLNFAMALLDYRPVIFLDEPTSGMDPGAKKRTWACVKRAVGRGCSVVLTSHSMEECEALCHRVVIMATGNFLCIGSIQYLKHKFGEKYVFKIKLQAQTAVDEEPKVKAFILASLPAAKLTEEHAAMLSYEIARYQGFKLSYLSEVLLTCRRTFLVEDISICQSSLEELFISMGNSQAELAAKGALNADQSVSAPQEAPKAAVQAPAQSASPKLEQQPV